MIHLTGYQILNQIHQSDHTRVYRATRAEDGRSVIVKVSAGDFPTSDEVRRFRREFEMGQTTLSNRVIRYFDLEPFHHGLALITEDVGGVGLHEVIPEEGMEPIRFLRLAMQMAEGLAAVHGRGLIHMDVKPANVVVQPESGDIKIIDLGHSITMEEQASSKDADLPGTPAYMSPEQTGRMNRPVDYRTDFYSLGVTFFQLLTGQLPFTSEDRLELVHAHIAKMPRKPHELRPKLPEVLSRITLKLMAKNVDDRYQSGRGLLSDLERCLEDMENLGRVRNFKLGAQDVTNRFSIPSKLYGREKETETLVNAYERAAEGGREMVLVEGYSGVGKSALVNEIRPAIFARNGYFIRGACDQANPNTAYHAIKGAFQEWVRQVLGERDEAILEWKERLRDVIGPNAAVMTGIIPEMAHLLDLEEEVHLGPIEIRNRFSMVFRGLIKGIARREHPLVLVLDDLHWADALTIKLLELILADKGLGYLLIIGTTKQHGLDGNHELARAVDEASRRGTHVARLRLSPLKPKDLTRMLLDTLHCEVEEARPLADIIISKTNGNPFFTNALLKNLYHEKYLRFCHDQSRWDWDLGRIRRIHVSENVIDFMIGRLKKLPDDTRHCLQLASCLGGTFDAHLLSELAEEKHEVVLKHLEAAVRLGAVIEMDEGYVFQFQHDRVQQAAYALIDERRKMEYHLRIGRMMRSWDEEERDIFEMVGHLNQGRELMEQEDERLTLARLNLDAGRKARASTAYENAVKYLRTSFSMMPEDAWDRHYDLVYSLFMESAECYYLLGSFKTAERFSSRLLEMARDNLMKASIYRMRLVHYTFASKLDDAVTSGYQGLALLNVDMDRELSSSSLMRENLRCRLGMLRVQPEDLLEYRELDDEHVAAVIDILSELGQPAYLTGNKALFTFSILRRVNLTFKHGISAQSANTFSMFGFLLNSVLNRPALGARYGKIALRISDKFGDHPYRCMTLYAYSIFIHCWNHPWKSLAGRLQETVARGLESGEPLYVSYAAVAMHYFDPDQDLSAAIEESDNNLSLIENYKGQITWWCVRLVQQFRLNLTGMTPDRFTLNTDGFDEAVCYAHFKENNVGMGMALFNLLKMRLAFLYGSADRADLFRRDLEQHIRSLTGQPFAMEACFYTFLVMAARFPKMQAQEKRKAAAAMKHELARMKRWAGHNPTNFSYHYNLMMGESERLKGRFRQAARYYRKAMEAAHRNGSLGDEALISELTGRFYLDFHQEKIATMFFTDAHYLYGRWGADAKVRQMEERYGARLGPVTRAVRDREGVVERMVNSEMPRRSTREITAGGKSEALDLATVTKWSLAISSEMNLDKLLSTMMHIILENAGAQKGFLILEQDGVMHVEASLSVEDGEVDLSPVPLDNHANLSKAIVRYVIRTGENVVLRDAAREGLFMEDQYVLGSRPKSVLCTPISQKTQLSGVLYLENNLVTNAFTEDRISLLNILLAQAAISLENARLYRDTKTAEGKYRNLSEELEERVVERTRELEAAQKELVEKAHLAGMADIATSVLHNVGNILNSVITSSQIIKRKVGNSSNKKVLMANRMLRTNIHNLETFIRDDPKGMQLMEYYLKLEEPILKEQEEIDEDVNRLIEKVNTIRDVIMAQQSHASKGFQEELMELGDVVEDALTIVHNAFRRAGITMERQFEIVGKVFVQKVKLIHILVNLLKNAREALAGNEEGTRKVLIVIDTDGEYNYIHITDNGVGIAEENMGKLFIHGYTTKPSGHGFGLHSCANSMTEMSGNIWAESDGPGLGATFVLQFPQVKDEEEGEPVYSRGADAGI